MMRCRQKTYTTEAPVPRQPVLICHGSLVKAGLPILLTPMARRNFDSTGTIRVRMMCMLKSFAIISYWEQSIPCLIWIDHSRLCNIPVGSRKIRRLLFNHLRPESTPITGPGKEDNTHFSELGARIVAPTGPWPKYANNCPNWSNG